MTASEHVRLLGVMISSSDLSLEKHVDTVFSKCFFWLRQLKRVRRSLDAESMKTLVHAFVTSRVDYGNIILVGAPKSVTAHLHGLSLAPASMIEDCHIYCILSCTGWTSWSGSRISLL